VVVRAIDEARGDSRKAVERLFTAATALMDHLWLSDMV